MDTERGCGARGARWMVVSVLGAAGLGGGAAFGQEAQLTPAATQPGVGQFDLRTQYRVTEWGSADDTGVGGTTTHESWWKLAVGLTPRVSGSVEVPFMARTDAGDAVADADAAGAGDARLELKWRFWQGDPTREERIGPLDTTRMAVFGGVSVPSGTGDLSAHAWRPHAGWVFTMVRGRHGFNQAITYTVATGTDREALMPGMGVDDLFEFESAYLYRVWPGRFSAESDGAWYLTAEVEGLAETNGDIEVLVSPGILFEGRRLAAEASVRLPAFQEVDERAEVDWGVVFGVRVLF